MAKKIKNYRFLSGLENEHSDPFVIREGKFSYGQLKDSYYYSDWTEHSFLSDSGDKEIVGRTFNFAKIFYINLFIISLFFILILRASWLQIISGDYYYSLAEGNRLRVETIEPRRGIIYDQKLTPLVRNTANFLLYLRPIDLPKDDESRDNLIRRVASILDGDSDGLNIKNSQSVSENIGDLSLVSDTPTYFKIKTALEKIRIGSLESYQPLFIVDNIEYEKAMILSLELNNLPGVFLSNKIRREYLFSGQDGQVMTTPSSLSHILGYTGKVSETDLIKFSDSYSLIDYIGKTGLEFYWEKELKGIIGKKNIEVDALGRQKKIVNEIPAQDGYNLRLSLDLELQTKAEEIVKEHLERLDLDRASVVIMDPNNGDIKALISLPAYDNNLFAKGIKQEDYQKYLEDSNRPLFNRSVSGEFPSGSTFKIVVASAALQEKVITENTSFLSTGGLYIGKWSFPDWRAGGHGMTNVKKAIAESVNTFFYYIGGGYKDFVGLGLDNLVKYSKLFGLGEKSGIDLPSEASGFVPTAKWKKDTKKESWYIGDTYHFAIGQGDVLVTPLQVANFTAVIANGGKLIKPRLVSEVLDSNNDLIRKNNPEIIREGFIDEYNIKIIREGMRQTVLAGSARSLQSLPVSAAGKTGTAQWSTKKSPHAWFTAFAPYENPEIVITVMIEEGVEGSTVSAPIARDIMQWYFGGHKDVVSSSVDIGTSTEHYLD